jgi:hypothetical protein
MMDINVTKPDLFSKLRGLQSMYKFENNGFSYPAIDEAIAEITSLRQQLTKPADDTITLPIAEWEAAKEALYLTHEHLKLFPYYREGHNIYDACVIANKAIQGVSK